MIDPTTVIMTTMDIKGQQFAMIDDGQGSFVNGMFARYYLVPMSTMNRNVGEDIRVKDGE